MTNERIQTRFAELGHTIDITEIESRMSTLTDQFKVPQSDAESSVVSHFLRQLGVDRADYYTGSGENQTVSIADIPQEEGKWINLRVKLVDIWDSTSDYIRQTGIVGDETGQVKFVAWTNAGLEEMVEGKCYMLDNVVTNVYNDRVSVTFNKTSVIEEISDDIEVGYTITEFTGALLAIKDNSGLIKRCPECHRALKSGECIEHGSVEGTNDLRIMAVLDDGASTQDILLNREMTEMLWGHTLDDATKMSIEALDSGVVLEDMRNGLVGRYYTVSGSMMENMMLVESMEAI